MAATSVAVTIKEEPKETGVQPGQVSLKYSLNSHLLLSVTLSVFVFKIIWLRVWALTQIHRRLGP